MKTFLIAICLSVVSWPKTGRAQEADPVLAKISVTLVTGHQKEDGLDNSSKLVFNFHRVGNPAAKGIFEFKGTDSTGGSTQPKDTKYFEIPLLNEQMPKSLLEKGRSRVEVSLNAVGMDRYVGNAQLLFTFSDGSTRRFDFGDFTLNSNRQPITVGKNVTLSKE